VLKYTGKEVSILERHGVPFREKLSELSDITGEDLTGFDMAENNFLTHELRNQYMSYLFSCTFSDLLQANRTEPDYLAGFSMGLYAALHRAGSIDYKTGALIISDVFRTIREILAGKAFSMASVIGFSREDIRAGLEKFTGLECVIQNGEHSFVLTGPSETMEPALEFFREEGAIHLSRFSVDCPYHSSVLAPHWQLFEELLTKYTIGDAIRPVTSFIDQRSIRSSREVKEEIVRNILTPLNFFQCLLHLENQGVTQMLEVGPGDSLTKSSKFIEGNFRFQALSKGKVL